MEPVPQTWADNYEDFDNYEGYDEKPCSVCAVPGKTNGQIIKSLTGLGDWWGFYSLTVATFKSGMLMTGIIQTSLFTSKTTDI